MNLYIKTRSQYYIDLDPEDVIKYTKIWIQSPELESEIHDNKCCAIIIKDRWAYELPREIRDINKVKVWLE
jgi:hypothetical protein